MPCLPSSHIGQEKAEDEKFVASFDFDLEQFEA